ncbi:hypothetical protein KC909_03320 [Candidatus Dojkabacteria bacterium]|uniref:Uncharacterized protein n=1 Tax=Candidatus Dojkabacteria bacterium TaxID=2099670 RepID=A0A955RJE3_9BACT|nr:hypothetical protein [Candidatus Dojkabacteria bacterium]
MKNFLISSMLFLFLLSYINISSAQITINHLSHSKRAGSESVAGIHTTIIADRNDAFDVVYNLPEVQEWLELFNGPNGTSSITGGRPVIKVDGFEHPDFIVHVFELTPTHTATFDWYYVNLEDGSVRSLNQELR